MKSDIPDIIACVRVFLWVAVYLIREAKRTCDHPAHSQSNHAVTKFDRFINDYQPSTESEGDE